MDREMQTHKALTELLAQCLFNTGSGIPDLNNIGWNGLHKIKCTKMLGLKPRAEGPESRPHGHICPHILIQSNSLVLRNRNPEHGSPTSQGHKAHLRHSQDLPEANEIKDEKALYKL